MKCEDIELLLIDYINRELSVEMNSLIEKHLGDCTSCRNNFEETEKIVANIKSISADIPVEEANKVFLKESLLKELRIYRTASPFLSALYRKKEEIKKQILGDYKKTDGEDYNEADKNHYNIS
ncbi:MAG: zf-HC2 domain-containing protein [Candidatus Eremiobacterota bacterium]